MKRKSLFAVLASVLLSGCLMTRNDVRDSETKRSNQDQVASMQKQQIQVNDTQNRISELESSFREMNGRLEVVENRASHIDTNAGKNQKALEEQVTDTQRKILLLQEEMIKLEGQLQSLTEQVAKGETKAESKSDEKTAKNENSDKKTGFEIGEELFEKKDWKKAILSYQKYRDQFPKGKKYPESTYKIGVCFQELNMKDDARTFFDELVAKFPNSQEARRAKIRLKKLK